MKLNELFEPNIRHREVRGHNINALTDDLMSQFSDETPKPGYGAYGKAVPNKKSPFTIKKNNFLPKVNIDYNDGYMYYIKSIVSNKMAQSNPFFPRVYDIVYLTDKYGDQRYRAEIEKLEHADAFSAEELVSLFKRLYPSLTENIDNYGEESLKDPDIVNGVFVHTIDFYLHEGKGYKPDNKLLKQALDYIKDLKRKNTKVSLDIHEDNIMYRRTSFGPQLVITDPFSNRG